MKKFNEVYDCDSITINVTNKCNLACPYCFEDAKNDGVMTFETAKKIIDESYRPVSENKGKFTINLFGGEPFLNWDLIKQLVDYTNKLKLAVKYGVTTNLTILNDEIIKYIDDNDIMLLISIDGIKKIHDKNRCNSYDIVIENLNKLLSKGLHHLIEVRMTVGPDDIRHLSEGLKSILDLKINNICPMFVTDQTWSDEQIECLKDQYQRMLDIYLEVLNDKNNNRNISIKNIDDIIINVLEPIVSDNTICPIGNHRWCAFDTNGDIYPCHQCPTASAKAIKEMKIGNIFEGIDENKVHKYDDLPKMPFDGEDCITCEGKSICKHGCPVQNIRENGSSKIPTIAHCAISILMVNIAKEFRWKLLDAENIRGRRLNVLKENLKLKRYFDDEVRITDIFSIYFQVKLDHFKEEATNMKDIIIPSFQEYYQRELGVIFAYLQAVRSEANGE